MRIKKKNSHNFITVFVALSPDAKKPPKQCYFFPFPTTTQRYRLKPVIRRGSDYGISHFSGRKSVFARRREGIKVTGTALITSDKGRKLERRVSETTTRSRWRHAAVAACKQSEQKKNKKNSKLIRLTMMRDVAHVRLTYWEPSASNANVLTLNIHARFSEIRQSPMISFYNNYKYKKCVLKSNAK